MKVLGYTVMTILCFVCNNIVSYGQNQAVSEVRRITNNKTSDWGPSIDDSGIAWIGYINNVAQVFYYDNNTIKQITNTTNKICSKPCLWNGTVAWREELTKDNGDKYYEVFFWEDNEIKRITDNKDKHQPLGNYGQPSLWNGKIAYRESYGRSQIYFYNGYETSNFTNSLINVWGASYNYSQLAYVATVNNGKKSSREIFFYDGITTKQISNNNTLDCGMPVLYSGQIVWRVKIESRYELLFWDGKVIHQITQGQFEPLDEISLYEGKIAWSGWDGNNYEIYYWDGTDIIQITDNNAKNRSPSLYGNRLAWESNNGKEHEIYMAVLTKPQITWTVSRITNNKTPDWGPYIDDSGIAWVGYVNNVTQLFYYDNNEIHQITNHPDQIMGRPRLYKGTIAWRERRFRSNKMDDDYYDIFYWNGTETTQLTDNKSVVYSQRPYGPPSLWNGKISYREYESPYSQIYFYDGETIRNFTGNKTNNWCPCNQYDQLAWKEVVNINGKNSLEIMLWDGTEIRQISNNNSSNNGCPSLSSGQIAYRVNVNGHYELFFWDGKEIHQITHGNYEPDDYPSLYNGKIAWSGWDGHDKEIYYWDGKDIIQITDNNFTDQAPTLYKNKLVWECNDGKTHEIYLAVFNQ